MNESKQEKLVGAPDSIDTSKVSRRSFLKSGAAIAAFMSMPNSASALLRSYSSQVFDYIVVGAGPGGGPIAVNLVKAGYTVALLEAGINPLNSSEVTDPLTKPLYDIPFFFTAASEHAELSWDYYVKHYSDPARQSKDSKYVPEKGILYPRGSALGGSAAHNAMSWSYPHNADFDRIADITKDESWKSEKMRAYFERLERCEYCEPLTPGRGFVGYMPANLQDPNIYKVDPVMTDIASAAAVKPQSYYQGNTNQDINHPIVAEGDTGEFQMPMHNTNHVRVSLAEYLTETQKLYPDKLFILTGALAAKVLTIKKNAVGVEYMAGADLYAADKLYNPSDAPTHMRIFARREVILSAGAFNTPQLLKLSGIGPKEELERLGINVVVNLPGVGENLQDRYEVPVSVKLKKNLSLLEQCAPLQANDPCYTAYVDGTWPATAQPFYGPYASNGVLATRVEKSTVSDLPDLMIPGLPASYTGIFPGYSATLSKDRWTWLVIKAHTTNTGGKVTLRSANPRDMPEINFHYFDEGNGDWQSDLQAVVEGVKYARGYLNDPQAKQHIDYEVTPGQRVQSDSDLQEYIKNEAWGHHASCSAKIGAANDRMAVLDGRFRVRGVKNLRVVDASVFPYIPGFFPVASILMISEKASDVILAEAKRKPKRRDFLSDHDLVTHNYL